MDAAPVEEGHQLGVAWREEAAEAARAVGVQAVDAALVVAAAEVVEAVAEANHI